MDTEYIITPSYPIVTEYSIGRNVAKTCRQKTFPNPYHLSDHEGKNIMPDICMHTLGKTLSV